MTPIDLIIIICEALVLLFMLRWFDARIRLALRKPSDFEVLKKPATEELRQIYREIDQDCGIIEPDLLTPEKSKAEYLPPSKEKLFNYLEEQQKNQGALARARRNKEMGEGLYKFAYGGMVYVCASAEEAEQKLRELKSFGIH